MSALFSRSRETRTSAGEGTLPVTTVYLQPGSGNYRSDIVHGNHTPLRFHNLPTAPRIEAASPLRLPLIFYLFKPFPLFFFEGLIVDRRSFSVRAEAVAGVFE